MTRLYTIGHSTHPIEAFVSLLRHHGISKVADVRSNPYSRFNPQFNRETLRKSLAERDMEYLFLGDELGARTGDPDCYVNGRVQYQRLAGTRSFRAGIERLLENAGMVCTTVMCAEKEPLICHRAILIAQYLRQRANDVTHILADGTPEAHDDSLSRLAAFHGLDENDLFSSREAVFREACRLQEEKIAYRRKRGSFHR